MTGRGHELSGSGRRPSCRPRRAPHRPRSGALPVVVFWHDGTGLGDRGPLPAPGLPAPPGHASSPAWSPVTGTTPASTWSAAAPSTPGPTTPRGFDVDDRRRRRRGRRARPRATRSSGCAAGCATASSRGSRSCMAKAVLGLLERRDGAGRGRAHRARVRRPRTGRAAGAAGSPCSVAMANVLPHLEPDDRPLALVHALAVRRPRHPRPRRRGSRAGRSAPAGRARRAAGRVVPPLRRDPLGDAAERALATAVAPGRSRRGRGDDVRGGHRPRLHRRGPHARLHQQGRSRRSAMLGAGQRRRGAHLARGPDVPRPTGPRSRASGATRIDLRSLARSHRGRRCAAALAARRHGRRRRRTERRRRRARLGACSPTSPRPWSRRWSTAPRAGATPEQLGRAVAFAAALRLVRFHIQNDHGDWDTVHHAFTTANASHQALVRQPTPELLRGIVHGALRVYLDRFLNVPAARLPDAERRRPRRARRVLGRPGRGRPGRCHRAPATCAAAASAPAASPRSATRCCRRMPGSTGTRSYEAGVRQALAWPEGSEESALVLVGVARFLAAHTPTRRELPTVVAHRRPPAARRGPLRRRLRPGLTAGSGDCGRADGLTDWAGDARRRPAVDVPGRPARPGPDVVDERRAGDRAVERFRDARHRAADLRPAGRPADHARCDHGGARRRRPKAADPRNLFRVHWYNDLRRRPPGRRRARARRAAAGADRRREPDHRRVRRPLPDDHRPQGAGRVRVPGAAGDHRAVRSDRAPRRSGRRRATTPAAAWPSAASWAAGAWPSCPPGCRRSASTGSTGGCADPADVIRTPGTREQRQGDLRRLQRAGRTIPTNFVLNQFCEFGNHLGPLRDHRAGPRGRVRARRRAAGPTCAWRRSCRPPARPARSRPATG